MSNGGGVGENGKFNSLFAIIERLQERVDDLGLLLNVLRTRTDEVNHRLNNIDVLLDNLRVQMKHHAHPETAQPGSPYGVDGEENP